MKRLGAFAVAPDHGEVMKFSEVYGIAFGDPGKQKMTFGDRNGPQADIPQAVCLEIDLPGHSEVAVGFNAHGGSNIGALAGDRVLIFADHAYAKIGDDGNYAELAYIGGKGGDLVGFISADGVDPLGERSQMRFNPANYKMEKIILPSRPQWPANGNMFVTLARLQGTIANQPMLLEYMGTDDAERGGEVDIPAEAVSIEVIEGTNAIPMSLGDLTGAFVVSE